MPPKCLLVIVEHILALLDFGRSSVVLGQACDVACDLALDPRRLSAVKFESLRDGGAYTWCISLGTPP